LDKEKQDWSPRRRLAQDATLARSGASWVNSYMNLNCVKRHFSWVRRERRWRNTFVYL